MTQAITAALRAEVAVAIQEEKEARIHEINELRRLCETSQKATKDLFCELETERVERCKKDSDLHRRLGIEISSIAKQMEIQIMALREQSEEKNVTLQEEIQCEEEKRTYELNEIRATLDATWRQIVRRRSSCSEDQPTKKRCFQDESGICREFLGGFDDMCTLYDLAKEAVDQSDRVEAGIAQERKSRIKQIDRLKERFDEKCEELCKKMDQMTLRIIPKTSCTLAALVENDPKWNLFLADPDELFNKDDVVDATYTQYLGDVLPLMIKHKCTFKVAIGMLAENRNVNSPEVSVVKPFEKYEFTHGAARSHVFPPLSEMSTDVEVDNVDVEDKPL